MTRAFFSGSLAPDHPGHGGLLQAASPSLFFIGRVPPPAARAARTSLVGTAASDRRLYLMECPVTFGRESRQESHLAHKLSSGRAEHMSTHSFIYIYSSSYPTPQGCKHTYPHAQTHGPRRLNSKGVYLHLCPSFPAFPNAQGTTAAQPGGQPARAGPTRPGT